MKPASQNQPLPKEESSWSSLGRRLLWFPRLFDRIHWKLTLSYTLFSVLLVIVLMVLMGIFAVWFVSYYYYANIPEVMSEQAEIIAPYFSDEHNTQEALGMWVDAQESFKVFGEIAAEPIEFDLDLDGETTIQILDQEQGLLASSDSSQLDDPRLEFNQIEQAMLDAVIAGNDGRLVRLTRRFPFRVFVTTPIEFNDRVVGVIIITEDSPLFDSELISFIGVILFIVVLQAMLVGTLFGFMNSRGITRRLKRLEDATSAWRKGDFATRVQDQSKDELGRLTARLNHMAEDLATHINTRQELAMLEERNRLALELHDSVKQQVFAIGMKLGFAETLTNDVRLIKTLVDLGELAHQTQDELQRLIHELKPVALEKDGLNAALKNYSDAWADLHGINVDYQHDLKEGLPNAAEQALFRITQESLANIAKHAQAQQVRLSIYQVHKTAVLNIRDDGCGFKPDKASTGLGRQSMLERITKLGGSFEIHSDVGKGTEVIAQIPFERETA